MIWNGSSEDEGDLLETKKEFSGRVSMFPDVKIAHKSELGFP